MLPERCFGFLSIGRSGRAVGGGRAALPYQLASRWGDCSQTRKLSLETPRRTVSAPPSQEVEASDTAAPPADKSYHGRRTGGVPAQERRREIRVREQFARVLSAGDPVQGALLDGAQEPLVQPASPAMRGRSGRRLRVPGENRSVAGRLRGVHHRRGRLLRPSRTGPGAHPAGGCSRPPRPPLIIPNPRSQAFATVLMVGCLSLGGRPGGTIQEEAGRRGRNACDQGKH